MRTGNKKTDDDLEINQRDLADLMGMNQPNVSRLEKRAIQNFKEKLKRKYGDVKDVLPE